MHLPHIHVTAAHGGTTVRADTASLLRAQLQTLAGPGRSRGTASDQDSGGPQQSTAPTTSNRAWLYT